MSYPKKRKISFSSHQQEINDGIAEINRNMMFNKLANQYYKEKNTEYEIRCLNKKYEDTLNEIDKLRKDFLKQNEELKKFKKLVKKVVNKYEYTKKDIEYQDIKDLFDELYIEKKINEELSVNVNQVKDNDNLVKFSDLYIS